MNIHGLKNKKHGISQMIKKEISKPRNQQDLNKIRRIETSMINLSFKINKLKEERKRKLKKK